MKITIYTISDCQFSAQEKTYLQSKNLTFEEKNLEANREFLTEMLAVSNNFAGTPVTKIEKDDGQIVVLKGFTQEEFDKTLGFAPQQASEPQVSAQQPIPAQAQPQVQAPAVPVQVQSAVAAVQPQPIAESVQAPNVAVNVQMPQAQPAMQPPMMQVDTQVQMPVQSMPSQAPAPVIPTTPEYSQSQAFMQPPQAPVQQDMSPQQMPPAQDAALNDILSSLEAKVDNQQPQNPVNSVPQNPQTFN